MPFKTGKSLKGWGVVRSKPWHFAGIYESEKEAATRAAELGEEYEIHFGENREGSDDFVWTAVD